MVTSYSKTQTKHQRLAAGRPTLVSASVADTLRMLTPRLWVSRMVVSYVDWTNTGATRFRDTVMSTRAVALRAGVAPSRASIRS